MAVFRRGKHAGSREKREVADEAKFWRFVEGRPEFGKHGDVS